MAHHRSRLDAPAYPGAGIALSCDARRRNAWLGERSANAMYTARTPGAALAAIARAALDESDGMLNLLCVHCRRCPPLTAAAAR
jgi:hypothetical protein